ncbi:LLM class F420-dependent oxidoreductase [Acrocarpospora pleiomorpha]|uniref:LLM class F420-dependent oxidoreductase n=1 Tax=Acrocarpospora pleiomorpha TaxID=90975 RepID=A0A5M3XQZ6_9ACTN|nr:LLM class F420-dependent oxidoreductase [Acrocarpospora pleiomorpha]GES22041.1 LLM class F420-dependent oxidoreductase [Acrocarpospora pleiomorpha]
MKIGISEWYPGAGSRAGRWSIESAQLIEELGFHSVWLPEHVVFMPRYTSRYPYEQAGAVEVNATRGVHDPLVLAGAIAAATLRLRIGTYVMVVPQRNPVVTARQIATVDQLSGGRFNFGVGVGWSAEEYAVLDVPFERRGARMDEYLRAMKATWSDDELTEFHGEFVDFPPLYAFPKPIQRPHPPIIVGGNSPATLRRIVELGDGWAGYSQSYDDIARFTEELENALTAAGRSRAEVSLRVGRRAKGKTEQDWEDDATYIRRCADLGLDEVVVSPRIGDDAYEHDMTRYAEIVGLR